MIVFDTNLLVRLATNDVPSIRTAVVELLERHATRISKTVLLETEWVLRSQYGYKASQFVDFVEYLLGVPALKIEDEELVRWANDAVNAGLDFADALHLSIAAAADESFYTLDETLFRKAARLDGVKVILVKGKK